MLGQRSSRFGRHFRWGRNCPDRYRFGGAFPSLTSVIGLSIAQCAKNRGGVLPSAIAAVATSSTPSRSSSIGWSRRCGAFSRSASDLHCGAIKALKQVCSSPRPLNQQKSERFRSPLSTWRAAGAILPPARTTTGGLSRSRLPLHEPTTARRVCWRREGSDPGRECVPSCNATLGAKVLCSAL